MLGAAEVSATDLRVTRWGLRFSTQLSPPEHDWAFAKRALARGDEPEEDWGKFPLLPVFTDLINRQRYDQSVRELYFEFVREKPVLAERSIRKPPRFAILNERFAGVSDRVLLAVRACP